MLPVPVKPFCAVTVTLLALSLTGCASNCPTPPAASLTLPQPPFVYMPPQPANYSLSAQTDIQNWRLKLTDILKASEPSPPLGR